MASGWIQFHWELETHAPVPGSYALHAVATVKSSQRELLHARGELG